MTSPAHDFLTPSSPHSADLAVIEDELQRGHPGQYSYVALLGLRRYDPLSIDAHVRRGFSYATVERLSRNTAFPVQRLAEVAGIPTRTLARRKEQGRLEPDESDRLARVSRVFTRTLALFEGDVLAAHDWLSAPHAALGGRIPIELASTDVGAQEVEHLVGRLEHGIPT